MITPMTMNNRMLDLWAKMEALDQIGISKLLYDNSIPFHIFATYSSDEKGYGISFSYPDRIKIATSSFANLKKLNVGIFNDYTQPNTRMLLIQLLTPSHRDTFSYLCESLINNVKSLNSEDEMINNVILQLDKWRNLFDKAGVDGLTPSEQQGLYGELTFLDKLLKKGIFTANDSLNYWVGVDAALRDFTGDSWAVEVKTTSTNNPQVVTINSERQLDETLFENLYLYHCSVEVTKLSGETLPEKIDKLRRQLEKDPLALSTFNEKLITAGYFDEDEHLYEARSYKLRDESFYKVGGNFPRIKECDLRKGVGDITYNIAIAACEEYRIKEATVLDTLKQK